MQRTALFTLQQNMHLQVITPPGHWRGGWSSAVEHELGMHKVRVQALVPPLKIKKPNYSALPKKKENNKDPYFRREDVGLKSGEIYSSLRFNALAVWHCTQVSSQIEFSYSFAGEEATLLLVAKRSFPHVSSLKLPENIY